LTDFQVALNPYYYVVEVPQPLWEVFGDVTNGIYDADLGRYTYPSSALPNGSLSFTIKNGYTTTIPAEELFRFPREYDDDGNFAIADDTYQISYVFNYTNEDADEGNFLYTWGLPFLSMNYLVMDMESENFRLSEAIRQDFGDEGGVAPVKLCTGTPLVEVKSKGINVGALVGEIIGGVAALLIIVGITWFCCRQRRNRRREATAPTVTTVPTAPTHEAYRPVPTGPTAYSPPPPGHLIYPSSSPGTYGPAPPMQMQMHPSPGYPAHSPSGHPVMTQTGYPKPYQAEYLFYPSSQPVLRAEAPSVVYSDSATTAVQELPSPDNHATEWRSSQMGSTGSDSDPSVCTSQARFLKPVMLCWAWRVM
jgi:hypothetical protein